MSRGQFSRRHHQRRPLVRRGGGHAGLQLPLLQRHGAHPRALLLQVPAAGEVARPLGGKQVGLGYTRNLKRSLQVTLL